jgi:two-component system CheB/CheR fusion protein
MEQGPGSKKRQVKNTAGKSPEKAALSLPQPPNPFPLVAIGASAGGLEAILLMLERLPAATGAAFVVLQHLSPNHESILPELLERKSKMPVHKVEDGMPVVMDNVYVIPPNMYLGLSDGHFTLLQRGKAEETFHVIDQFFSSMAPLYQNKAIAVILSGTATDGTAGVRSIKAEGGITFAQDDSAKFKGMPRNAIDSGYIDFVLAPERIATEIQAIVNGLYRNELRVENVEKREDELRKIHLLLLKKHDVDFSLYKQTTIIRRIIRRMSLNRAHSLDQYIDLLYKDSREVDMLYRDLLINVTSFFREPSLYAALIKRIFPMLLKDRGPNDPIRIWIPACATGEEPYSVAICFFEYLKDKAITTPIQIFSTDLSETAIARARSGIYGKNTLVNVSPQRLRKFFVKVDGSYQIIKPIRDICIFASHNLLKDPPFSRMDMISCQNVLIYMEQAAQKKIMQAFNYALKPAKYLVLGKSETIGSSTDLFDQVDKDLRIYSKKTAPANMHFDFSIRGHSYLPDTDNKEAPLFSPPPPKEVDIEKEAERLMLSLYMPASILVNKDLQILRFYGSTFLYLQPASGRASLHLLKMIRDELIFELRSLIKQAKKDGKSARKDKVQISDNGQLRDITLEVQPVSTSADPHLLIVFQPSAILEPPASTKRPVSYRQDEKDRRLLALEKELGGARDHVKSITEDFEATREELQSANEEVLSSNEELQSINEELETSKEELQSTNEELITINEELQLRNTELKESVDYSKAIIETIREPLLVLNTDLRILTVNQAFYTTFRLGQDDVEGNYLYEVGNGMFDLPGLNSQLKKMMARNTWFQDFEIAHSFAGIGNKILLMNATRMAGEPGKRARILLAMEDITEGHTAKKALYASEERFRHVSESGFINIAFFSPEGLVLDTNDAWLHLTGYGRQDIQAGRIHRHKLTPAKWIEESMEQLRILKKTGRMEPYEREYIRKDKSRFWVMILGGNLENDIEVEFVIDISERKSREFRAAFLNNMDQDLTKLNDPSEIKNTMANKLAEFFGVTRCIFAEIDAGSNLLTIDHDWHTGGSNLKESYAITDWYRDSSGKVPEGTVIITDTNRNPLVSAGKERFERTGIRSLMAAIHAVDGKCKYLLAVCHDTPLEWKDGDGEFLQEVASRLWRRLDRAAAEDKLQVSEDERLAALSNLDVALEAVRMGVWELDMKTLLLKRNARFDELLDYDPAEKKWNIDRAQQALAEEDKKAFAEAFRQMPEQGLNFNGRVLTAGSGPRWIRLYGKLFYQGNGQPDRAAGIIVDITEQKSIEKQKDEFISVASHELKTPVTSIRAYADILLENFKEAGDKDSAGLLEKLKGQTDRLTTLIRDLLDVTRITEGHVQLKKTNFDLNQLILATVEEMQRMSLSHRLVPELQTDELPFFGDRDRMAQVLTNLVSNAVKYSPDSTAVIISSSVNGQWLSISVKDAGIGLSKESQERAFERFYRSSDPKLRSYPGMGLGLYISAEIIRQHGGEIAVISEEGKGALFTVRLPAGDLQE